ncbi:MAG TPA: YdcF family protein [Burkholderiaceae bacterium]|nr:YdcF family protein [Burkholderiaceae bacterium]
MTYLLSSLVLPPTSLVLLTLLGLLLLTSRPRFAVALMAFSQLTLLALAMPVVAGALARSLEPPPLAADGLKRAQAIVILAGGLNRSAIEWGGETVNDYTLQRVRYGAHLARLSGLPIYVTGGVPGDARHSEAQLMAGVLQRDYAIQPKWVDQSAPTTRGNALMAASDLKPLGIQRVALVTTAIHMPRSKQAFEAAGFTVIAAPTHYFAQRPFSLGQLAPGAGALVVSYLSLREWISRGWYRLLGS